MVSTPAGREAEARPAPDELPSSGLLSFYDRLRLRVTAAADRRSGKMGRRAVELLLAAPDLFILLLRLSIDREVPQSSRALFLGAIAYFVLPLDLLPEAFSGPAGYLDDVVLAGAVLAQALGGELEPKAELYWSGSRRLREVLRDIGRAAQGLLGHDIYGRLERLLARRGVKLVGSGAAS